MTGPISAPGAGKSRKHPAIAVSTSGDTLVACAEGPGWQRGGDLAWQVFDKSSKATDQRGRALRGIPVWGLPTAVATAEGASSSSTDSPAGFRDGSDRLERAGSPQPSYSAPSPE